MMLINASSSFTDRQMRLNTCSNKKREKPEDKEPFCKLYVNEKYMDIIARVCLLPISCVLMFSLFGTIIGL